MTFPNILAVFSLYPIILVHEADVVGQMEGNLFPAGAMDENAEGKEKEHAEAAPERQEQRVENGMNENGDKQHEDKIAARAADKAIERIVIAHQHGIGRMTKHREDGTQDGQHLPLRLTEKIENILNGRKAQSYTSGIDDAVVMLVEIAVAEHHQEESHELEHLFENSIQTKSIHNRLEQTDRHSRRTEKHAVEDALKIDDRQADERSKDHRPNQPHGGLALGVDIPKIVSKQQGGQYGYDDDEEEPTPTPFQRKGSKKGDE